MRGGELNLPTPSLHILHSTISTFYHKCFLPSVHSNISASYHLYILPCVHSSRGAIWILYSFLPFAPCPDLHSFYPVQFYSVHILMSSEIYFLLCVFVHFYFLLCVFLYFCICVFVHSVHIPVSSKLCLPFPTTQHPFTRHRSLFLCQILVSSRI